MVLIIKKMGRVYAWLVTGRHDFLLDASNLVCILTVRQSLQVVSADEMIFSNNCISNIEIKKQVQ